MDVCTKPDKLISIKEEEIPQSSCFSELDAFSSEMNLPVYTHAINDLFEVLPKERKTASFTKEHVVMEAVCYALELEQSLQKDEKNMKDISSRNKKRENCPFRSAEEIKRPRNGFIRFAMKYRTEMALKYPNLDNRNISCLLGMKWKKMCEEERKPYEEEFKEDMKLLREKHPNWMYTPKKNRVEEAFDVAVLPTRLRPKEKRKRKVFDCFEETYPSASKQKPKPQPGCKRRPRKQSSSRAKEKASYENIDINCLDLFNAFFVDTVLMPNSVGPNMSSEVYSFEIENDKLNPLDINRNFNNDCLSVDWENELFETMNPLTHPWLQGVDRPVKLSQEDFCNIQNQM